MPLRIANPVQVLPNAQNASMATFVKLILRKRYLSVSGNVSQDTSARSIKAVLQLVRKFVQVSNAHLTANIVLRMNESGNDCKVRNAPTSPENFK